jgi:uncharacterized protein (TIGR01777 family)
VKVVIAGGTGFLGRPLAQTLARGGTDVVILGRKTSSEGAASVSHPNIRFVTWDPADPAGSWRAEIGGAAVVNLAGESIAARRWSAAQKQRILDSRLQATEALGRAIRAASSPVPVFVSGSAVGYYGPLDDEVVREEHAPGSDFLADVCEQWESAAVRSTAGATRVVCIRTGLVLERDGGALPRMLLPFKLGLGGVLGSGRQYMPWIHRADWIALVQWAIENPAVSGPINATAPHPVTNGVFTKALGRALHRPTFLPAPAFALRLLLGEMADALLLSGQNVVPAKAQRSGFSFQYQELERAFAAIFHER